MNRLLALLLFFRAHDSVKDTVKKFSAIGSGPGSPETTRKVSHSKPPAAGKALDSSTRAKKERPETASTSASQPKRTPAGKVDVTWLCLHKCSSTISVH